VYGHITCIDRTKYKLILYIILNKYWQSFLISIRRECDFHATDRVRVFKLRKLINLAAHDRHIDHVNKFTHKEGRTMSCAHKRTNCQLLNTQVESCCLSNIVGGGCNYRNRVIISHLLHICVNAYFATVI